MRKTNREKKRPLELVCFLVITTLVSLLGQYFFSTTFSASSGVFELYSLDVGQGDATLVKTPEGLYGLLDTGAGTSVLTQLGEVMPFNVKTLDFVLLSHYDQDHAEGLLAILDHYQVKQVFLPRYTDEGALAQEIHRKLSDLNVPSFLLDDEHDFQLGSETYFDVLWPDDTSADASSDNNNSVAVTVTYLDLSAFVGGDLEADYELKSIKSMSNPADIDVLKVSHHGSKYSTSSEFLEKITPLLALISVGSNSYGHPAPETLERLSQAQVDVVRTDIDGRVKLSYRAGNLQVETAESLENYVLKL